MEAIEAVPWVILCDPVAVEVYARDMIADGAEGVVAKPLGGGYDRSGRTDWLRIKRRQTYDYEVLGVTPYPDSREAIAGLVIAWRGKPLRVTAGFTEAERAELWRERAIITGRIVEIAAMEETVSGSLRQPRFERVRYERIWANG